MSVPMTTKMRKSSLRKDMRTQRRALSAGIPSPNLHPYFKDIPQDAGNPCVIAGFAPIGNEINIWPLLGSLHHEGHRIVLPVVMDPHKPLLFREWTPGCDMETDRYGVSFPADGDILTPHLILVPLLAFTYRGDRLGYGGGYYDRTLDALRRDSEAFACGVAYAGQEVAELPTDAHDAKIDGILTENAFRTFT